MNDLETALGNLGDLGIPAASAARRFVDEAGEMVDIAYTTIDSPLGELIIAATPRGLLRIGFENETGVLDDLAERVSPRILEYPARLERIRHELGEYFAGHRDRFEVPLDWGLIDGFRRRVLTVTAQIPYGGVATLWGCCHLPGRCPSSGSTARCPRRRTGTWRQPHSGHHSVPPGGQERGRHGRLRRWHGPQGVPAPARGCHAVSRLGSSMRICV